MAFYFIYNKKKKYIYFVKYDSTYIFKNNDLKIQKINIYKIKKFEISQIKIGLILCRVILRPNTNNVIKKVFIILTKLYIAIIYRNFFIGNFSFY